MFWCGIQSGNLYLPACIVTGTWHELCGCSFGGVAVSREYACTCARVWACVCAFVGWTNFCASGWLQFLLRTILFGKNFRKALGRVNQIFWFHASDNLHNLHNSWLTCCLNDSSSRSLSEANLWLSRRTSRSASSPCRVKQLLPLGLHYLQFERDCKILVQWDRTKLINGYKNLNKNFSLTSACFFSFPQLIKKPLPNQKLKCGINRAQQQCKNDISLKYLDYKWESKIISFKLLYLSAKSALETTSRQKSKQVFMCK